MVRNNVQYLFILLFIIMFTGCSGVKQMPAPDNNAGFQETRPEKLHPDLCERLNMENSYINKVDNFIVIFDTSASLSEVCNGRTKLELAIHTALCLNNTIPEIELTAGLRTFGNPVYTSLCYGMTSYSRSAFADALKSVNLAAGVSPLEFAIDELEQDLQGIQGRTAVIIISDGKGMDMKPVLAAKQIKRRLGDRICIYTILAGNDPNGKSVLDQIAQAGECGFSINADTLVSGPAMADFVKNVFLDEVSDTDKDGVNDLQDECRNTPRGVSVDENGCWVIEDVLFDFDKFDIKPEGYPVLNEVAEVMQLNSSLKILIHGHTDIIGSERYNDKLSINRAKAGLKYLVEKGIDPERIFIKGFGYSKPKVTENTDAGRSRNRRIEFKIVSVHP
jgi:OOP family OmpA-OmpF porin